MDWREARAAIQDRSCAAEKDTLCDLRYALDECDTSKEARRLIVDTRDVADQMLTMLDEWTESAVDDGADD